MAKKAGWDTAYGYELYLEGKSDGEIADACKVQISTVQAYRLRRWRKNPDGGRAAPGEAERPEETATAACGGSCAEESENHRKESLEGGDEMKKVNWQAETGATEIPCGYPPVDVVETMQRGDGVICADPELGEAYPWEQRIFDQMQRKLDVVAEATEDMSGIRAICTAGAIEALWKWEDSEALYKARAYIDYMIRNGVHGYG